MVFFLKVPIRSYALFELHSSSSLFYRPDLSFGGKDERTRATSGSQVANSLSTGLLTQAVFLPEAPVPVKLDGVPGRSFWNHSSGVGPRPERIRTIMIFPLLLGTELTFRLEPVSDIIPIDPAPIDLELIDPLTNEILRKGRYSRPSPRPKPLALFMARQRCSFPFQNLSPLFGYYPASSSLWTGSIPVFLRYPHQA